MQFILILLFVKMHIYVWLGQAAQLRFLDLPEDGRLQMVHTRQQNGQEAMSETVVFRLTIRDLITTLAETLRRRTTYLGFSIRMNF